jgi:hypothetical protein
MNIKKNVKIIFTQIKNLPKLIYENWVKFKIFLNSIFLCRDCHQWWLVLIGIFGAGFLIWQIILLQKTVADTKKSADAAKDQAIISQKAFSAENRPWVKEKVTVDGPLEYNNKYIKGMSVIVQFNLTNVGKSPALNAVVHAEIIARVNDGSADDRHGRNPITRQREICDLARQRSGYPTEVIIFPEDTISVRPVANVLVVDNQELEKVIQAKITQESRTILFTIVGCVDYRSNFEDEHHQTRFMYDLRKSDSQHPETTVAISIDDGDIPANNLRLFNSDIPGVFSAD